MSIDLGLGGGKRATTDVLNALVLFCNQGCLRQDRLRSPNPPKVPGRVPGTVPEQGDCWGDYWEQCRFSAFPKKAASQHCSQQSPQHCSRHAHRHFRGDSGFLSPVLIASLVSIVLLYSHYCSF